MRSAFLFLVALLAVFCVASAYAAPPCPGGVCPAPVVVESLVVAEVAAPQPVRKVAKGVVARQPVRTVVKRAVARQPVRGIVARKPLCSAVKAAVSRKPARRVLQALRPCK